VISDEPDPACGACAPGSRGSSTTTRRRLTEIPRRRSRTTSGPRYIQHNPEAQDGPEAFTGFVHWLRGEYPNLTLDIKRVIDEGDWWSRMPTGPRTRQPRQLRTGAGGLFPPRKRQGGRALGRHPGHSPDIRQRQRHVLTGSIDVVSGQGAALPATGVHPAGSHQWPCPTTPRGVRLIQSGRRPAKTSWYSCWACVCQSPAGSSSHRPASASITSSGFSPVRTLPAASAATSSRPSAATTGS
jgi:hypothetical protein